MLSKLPVRIRRVLNPLSLPLLGLWLALGLPASAQAQLPNDGWVPCAREGQACTLTQRGMVRYGVDGQWTSRVAEGRVDCSNKTFGDPAPEQPKRCEVREASRVRSADGWVFCAAEGEVCQFRGDSEVRFGTEQRFNTRHAQQSIRCDVDSFGDPMYGRTKHCEVRANAALNQANRDPFKGWGRAGGQGDDWRYCAAEGQTCRVQGQAEVRFGDGRRFASRTVQGEVACDPGTFGDPAKGVLKHCEVRRTGFVGWGNNPAQDGGWARCADEGQRCELPGGATQVRYGTDGRYVYRDVFGGLNCETSSFGSDPFPGRRKQCEARR